jgi:hypothetical protein
MRWYTMAAQQGEAIAVGNSGSLCHLGSGVISKGNQSLLILRWRELDSNPRFRARAGSILPVRFVADSLLEGAGFEPSVPLVSRGADSKRFLQLAGGDWRCPGASIYVVAAPFCELDPVMTVDKRPYAFVIGTDGHLGINFSDGPTWQWSDRGVPWMTLSRRFRPFARLLCNRQRPTRNGQCGKTRPADGCGINSKAPRQCLEAFYLPRTWFELIVERKLRRRQLTERGDYGAGSTRACEALTSFNR